MSTLREAAQAVVDQWDEVIRLTRSDAIDHLRAALAQPEAQPVAWMYDWEADGEVVRDWVTLDRDEAHSPTMGCHNIRPLYTHPPRDEWREAVHDELVTIGVSNTETENDPRLALRDIINWHVHVALDPAISSDAQALIERGKAMRDVTPPGQEGP